MPQEDVDFPQEKSLRFPFALAITLLLLLGIVLPQSVAAQSFEELIEETLRRLRGNEPAAEPQQPQPVEPGAPATVQQIVPVEPGPRPYTPPKVPRPAGVAVPPQQQSAPQPAPPQTVAPEPASPEPSIQAEPIPAPAEPDIGIEPAPTLAPAAQEPVAPPPAPADAQAVQDLTAAPIESGATGVPDPTAEVTAPGVERTRESLTPDEVNGATFPAELAEIHGASPLVLKAQVMLDRAGASPGAIDAYTGANLSKAVAAVEAVLGLPVDGKLDREVWDALGGDNAPAVLVRYTISNDDVSYPFVPNIPADYAEQAKLQRLGYSGPGEMFGERFHMDTKLLRALNPQADFAKAGTEIWVTAIESPPITAKVARIVVDKEARQVRAYDGNDHLIVAYPATIGSPDNPSPSGEHVVKAVATDPVYYYDPANFVQGGNMEKLQLPPGPNSPVGSVWIDLSDPGYGIHGTPEPTRVDKTGSHGCVRLTNWDAEELASLVSPGVIVSFTE